MISDKTKELFREFRSAICDQASVSVDKLRGSDDLSQVSQGDAFLVLRKHLRDQDAMDAFKKVLCLTCYGSIASVCSLLDGSLASTNLYVSLKDRDSDEDLAPVDDSYLDAFVGYIMDREEEDDWPIRL